MDVFPAQFWSCFLQSVGELGVPQLSSTVGRAQYLVRLGPHFALHAQNFVTFVASSVFCVLDCHFQGRHGLELYLLTLEAQYAAHQHRHYSVMLEGVRSELIPPPKGVEGLLA